MSRRHPLVIGHRGAPGYRPEHSASSYALALAAGVDAVEPDAVVSRDGVLVVRHENEISETTDVAARPEFAGRRATCTVDGIERSGWFTEDFTADELAGLRCRERVPALRPASAAFDDTEPVLRLREVLDLVRAASIDQQRPIGVVLELKHATHFGQQGWDVAALVAAELEAAGWLSGDLPLVIESFEQTVLAQLQVRGVPATYVYLVKASGRPYDLVAAQGAAASTYRSQLRPAGLDAFADRFDGISVNKRLLLLAGSVVADAHARGLEVYTWTCRPENTFLDRRFRRAGGAGAFGAYEQEWAVIRDAGVDGVFVDHPDLGVAFFGA
ncbi:MAG: glycerophosphodiester phosphodiesterase family protein [Microbacterium sp.]|uniref:glycerophosphodiester phosphodiesterase family protein n=1 Tax=Microbacterium sp. TaxID=51671 RepID=UPI003A856A58